jgi:hypothetical protein
VYIKTSTKPPIHNLIHEFLINMVFTMACPNFKKGLKMAFGPLGVSKYGDLTFISVIFIETQLYLYCFYHSYLLYSQLIISNQNFRTNKKF